MGGWVGGVGVKGVCAKKTETRLGGGSGGGGGRVRGYMRIKLKQGWRGGGGGGGRSGGGGVAEGEGGVQRKLKLGWGGGGAGECGGGGVCAKKIETRLDGGWR